MTRGTTAMGRVARARRDPKRLVLEQVGLQRGRCLGGRALTAGASLRENGVSARPTVETVARYRLNGQNGAWRRVLPRRWPAVHV